MFKAFEIAAADRDKSPTEDQLAALETLRRLRDAPYRYVSTQAEAEEERRLLWAS